MDISNLEFSTLSEIIDLVPIPVIIWEIVEDDLILKNVNINSLKVFGKNLKDLLGMPASRLYKTQPNILDTLLHCAKYKKSILTKSFYNTLTNQRTVKLKSKIDYVDPNLLIVFIQDITEPEELKVSLQKTKQKLSESEALFKAIFDNVKDVIFVKDRDLKYVRVSKSLEEMFQLKEGQIIGKDDRFLFGRDDGEKVIEDDRKVLEGNITDEEPTKPVDGEYRTFHTVKTPLKNNENEIIGIVGIARDITEKKRAQQKIIIERKRAQEYIDIAGVIILILDENANIKLINKKGSEILGDNKSSLIGRNWIRTFIPQEEQSNIFHIFQSIMNGQEIEFKNVISSIKTLNKEKRIISWQNTILKDKDGKIIGTLSSGTDITDIKQIEAELRESRTNFKNIIESSINGILIIQNNELKYINSQAANLIGCDIKELKSSNHSVFSKLLCPKSKLKLTKLIKNYNHSTEAFNENLQLRIKNKKDEILWIELSVSTLSYNQKPALLISMIDITESKQAEKELIYLNNLKSEFIKRISHELKTPIVSIKGFANLILELYDVASEGEVIKYLKEILGGSERLEILIKKLLESSKLKQGTLDLDFELGDLSLVIEKCISNLRNISDSRNHQIDITVSRPLKAKFDSEAILEILNNLISNAIKYTPPGGKIKVSSVKENGFHIISVEDNGIGLSKQERTQLFKQFGKIEKYGQGLDIEIDGTGLGLYNAKKLVELHGGEIWVDSEGENNGSTFSFSIPATKSE